MTFRVSRGATVRGRVLDHQGKAIAGAQIVGWCLPRSTIDRAGLEPPHRSTVSRMDGSFSLEHMGEEVLLSAELPGWSCYQRIHGRVQSGQVCDGVELRMTSLEPVRGDVFYRSGTPVRGAEVRTQVVQSSGPSDFTVVEGLLRVGPARTSTWTDAIGGFEVLAPSGQRFEIRVAGDVVWSGQLRAGPTLNHVVLENPLKITGVVLGVDGQALPGVQVQLTGKNRRKTTTEGGGVFELLDLKQDASAWLSVSSTEGGYLVLGPRSIDELATEPLNLQLPSRAELRGQIFDDQNQPVQHAWVSIEGVFAPVPEPGQEHFQYWGMQLPLNRTISGSDGEFLFDHLSPGAYQVRIRGHRDPEPETSVMLHTGPTLHRVRLSSTSLLRLGGRVKDARTGIPVSPFTVQLLKHEGDQLGGCSMTFDDPEGAFVLEGLRVGHYELQIEAPGYSGWVEPNLVLDRPLVDLSVPLTAVATPRKLILHDHRRRPVPRARIRFSDSDGRILYVRAGPNVTAPYALVDDAGEAVLRGLPAGVVSAEVRDEDRRDRGVHQLDLTTDIAEALVLTLRSPP